MDDRNRDARNKRSMQEREGVIYEPSRPEERKEVERASSSRGAPKKMRKKSQPSNFALFYVITIVTGVAVCIVIFLTVFNSMINNGGSGTGTPPEELRTALSPRETATPTPFDPEVTEDMVEGLGVVLSVSLGSNSLTISDLVNARSEYILYVDSSSRFTNKHNEALVFQEIKPGDIVDFAFERETQIVKTIRGSNESWEYRKISNVSVDMAKSTIKIGKDTYSFDRNLIVNTEKHEYTLDTIAPSDTVTVRGYKDKLCFLELVTGHGTLNIINKPDILDGTIEIDTEIYKKLNTTNTIAVPEGRSRIVVKGKNIEPYIKEVTLVHGQQLDLDLSDIEIIITEGTLQLYIDQEDFKLTIDGRERKVGEPIVLKFGKYKIRVEKSGFEPFEETVTISEPTQSLNVSLKGIIVPEEEEPDEPERTEKPEKTPTPTVAPTSKLIIITEPVGADIYLDNVFIGISPLEKPVTMGKHSVMVRKEGYLSPPYNVTIEKSEHKMLIDLQRQEDAIPPVTTDNMQVEE